MKRTLYFLSAALLLPGLVLAQGARPSAPLTPPPAPMAVPSVMGSGQPTSPGSVGTVPDGLDAASGTPGGPTGPVTAVPGAPATEGGPRVSTRQIVYMLRDFGARGPMTMRGTTPIQGVVFGVRDDEVVTEAKLVLSGATSPAMLPDYSNVTVTLNEEYIGTIPTIREKPRFENLEMVPNPVFFQETNRLNFRFTGRYTMECNDPLSGLLWSSVSDTSTLTLTLARLPTRFDLARLPLPFFDRNLQEKLVLPFVLGANPSNEALQAAGMIASWFGRLVEDRGASFPVLAQAPAQANAILVAMGAEAAAGYGLPALTGPTLAVVANPNNPLASILVVAGRTGAEVVTAATVLTLGHRTLSGPHAAVANPTIAPRKPYDAPAWIATDRPVRFGELVEASVTQGVGYVPGIMHVPFHIAPDLYTWRGRPHTGEIRLRAPGGPIEDIQVSRLEVGINGMLLRSYSLDASEGSWNWVKRQAGSDVIVRGGSLEIPPYMVFGQNNLQLYFDTRPLHRGDCRAVPDDVRVSVDPDSTMDFSRAYHFTSLPNLAFFASSAFPFTRMADLSETAVVLPERPQPLELSAYLGLMGQIGALTGYPVIRVAVVRPSAVAQVADRDLLMVGTLTQLAGAANLLANSAHKIDGDRLSVQLPAALDGIWRLFGDTQGEERRKAAAALTAGLNSGAGALVGAQSPFNASRSVVALVAGQPQGLIAVVDALRDAKLNPNFQGDLSLLAGGRVTAYRAGPTYTVGYLPFWLWPNYWLRDTPASFIWLLVGACMIVGLALYRALRKRAAAHSAVTRSTP